MTTTLHAHVSTASADCDGPIYRSYVATYNRAETAEHESAQGVNDFSDIHFMQRVMMNHCSPFAVRQMRVTLDETGVEWHEDTEEGYRNGEIRWCRDDCDTDETGYRDVYAERAGY